MYEVFADLHIHIGRASNNKPIKITAARSLNFENIAKECVDMGFYIGVGGVVTFKNGKKLREVVDRIPMEKILLETDCPYLSPEPHRGERNSSLNLPYVVKEIANIKGISEEDVIRITEENAKRMYGLMTEV